MKKCKHCGEMFTPPKQNNKIFCTYKCGRQWHQKFNPKVKQTKLILNRQYQTGWTGKQYDETYNKQKGCCLICNKYEKKLDADHCHKTKSIRGLLCHRCNLGLGLFDDNYDKLISAANYVKEYETK